MQRNWILTSIIALVPAVATAQDKPKDAAPAVAKPADTKKPFAIGSAVDTSIALTDLAGKKHTLKDYAGKTVVIDFWSIECPVSQGYEERFKKLFADYEKKGVVFLMVDANAGEIAADAKIKDYVKKNTIPYPILLDTGNAVADRFGAQTTPHVFIVDGKGVLRYAGSVDDNDKADAPGIKNFLRDALDALAAGKEPPQTSTKPHGCSIKRAATKN